MASNRTAIGNERRVDIAGDKVMLHARADNTGGKRVNASATTSCSVTHPRHSRTISA